MNCQTLGILSTVNGFRSGKKQTLLVDTVNGESAFLPLEACPWGLSSCMPRAALNLEGCLQVPIMNLFSVPGVSATVGLHGSHRGKWPSGFMCPRGQHVGQCSWAAVSHGSPRSQTASRALDTRGEGDSWDPGSTQISPASNTIAPFVKLQVPLKLTVGPTQDKLRKWHSTLGAALLQTLLQLPHHRQKRTEVFLGNPKEYQLHTVTFLRQC